MTHPMRGPDSQKTWSSSDTDIAFKKENAMKKSTSLMKPMKRGDITDLVAFSKITLGIKWAAAAKKIDQSKE